MFILLNPDDSILDAYETQEIGSIEISDVDADVIAKSKFGHSVYDYVGGILSVNQARFDSVLLGREKQNAISLANEVAVEETIRLKALPTINKINNANDLDALNNIDVEGDVRGNP